MAIFCGVSPGCSVGEVAYNIFNGLEGDRAQGPSLKVPGSWQNPRSLPKWKANRSQGSQVWGKRPREAAHFWLVGWVPGGQQRRGLGLAALLPWPWPPWLWPPPRVGTERGRVYHPKIRLFGLRIISEKQQTRKSSENLVEVTLL